METPPNDPPPPEEAPPPPKTIESLPGELLGMIFAYDDISLAQLFALRSTSKTIGPCASNALIDRIHRVLFVRGDFRVFEKFLGAIQQLQDPTAPLQPASVGKLLKRARIPMHSVAVTAVARYLIEARPGGSHQKAALLYKAMDAAKVGDVKMALYGLGYWTREFEEQSGLNDDGEDDDDDGDERGGFIGSILEFVKAFDFPELEAVDLLLSLDMLGFWDRWKLVGCLLGWIDANEDLKDTMSVDTFINVNWPRAVKLARLENNDDGFDPFGGMLDDLDEVMELFGPRFWEPSHKARLFEPAQSGLTTQEMARLIIANNDADFLGCYITDHRSISQQDNETDLSTRGTTTLPVQAQPDQARRLFEAMGRLDDFPRLVGILLRVDRWPIYMDPLAPDFRELVVLNEERLIEKLCRPLATDFLTGDVAIEEKKRVFRRFLAANGARPRFRTWLAAVQRTIATEGRRREGMKPVLYVLRDVLEEELEKKLVSE